MLADATDQSGRGVGSLSVPEVGCRSPSHGAVGWCVSVEFSRNWCVPRGAGEPDLGAVVRALQGQVCTILLEHATPM